MKHNDVKNSLLQDSELRASYEESELLFHVIREVIRLRIEQDLSQKQLADLVGTKQSAISRLESGNSNPSVEFLSKVAHALGKNLYISFQ